MEEERINHLKRDQVICGGKKEDVGLDELEKRQSRRVLKILECFGGDLGSGCMEIVEVRMMREDFIVIWKWSESYLVEEKVVMVEDCDFVSKDQELLFCVFVSSHEKIC
ncbi:hypothetical protein Tco_1162015 [Tanacetum coccineum]